MKQLLPTNEYGIYADKAERILVDSRYVAEKFGKQHAHVMRDIREKILPYVSEEFNLSNFGESSYKNTQNKKQPMYVMTQEGFNFLVFSYNDKTLYPYKEEYIKQFNQMESYLQTYISVRDEFPLITEGVKQLYINPQRHHFSNETNMLYVLVTGLNAKQLRMKHGLPDKTVIRPYLSQEELNLLDILYKIDIGLLVSTPEYHDRKAMLTQYKDSYISKYQLMGA